MVDNNNAALPQPKLVTKDEVVTEVIVASGNYDKPDKPKMMKVSIEIDGEFITTEVPVDRLIRATISDDGHLRGISVIY